MNEIQHVNEFERVVDSLYIHKNMDIYITGSNVNFMTGELATLLSGRYIELKMLPLSFKEYCQGTGEERIDEMFVDNELTVIANHLISFDEKVLVE